MNSVRLDRVGVLLREGVRSSIGRNVISLYLLQFANYTLPLVTVPYLVRVLGAEKFGTVAFGQSLIAYFALVVNYGFDWSATRKISVQRDDLEAVSRTAASVWAAEALLCGVGFLALLGLISIVPRFTEIGLLLLILYGTVVGSALFPVWLFQGMEQMAAISVINLAARAVTTVGIFLFIRRPADFILYAALLAFQWMATGLVGVMWACRRFKISLVWPGWDEVRRVFIEGWALFFSNGAVGLYTAGNAFILGLLTNNTAVGYYSAAERLVKAAQLLLGPVSQAVYPRFSKMVADSRRDALKWGRRMLFLMSVAGLLLSFGLLAGTRLFVQVLLGPEYGPSMTVLRILAPLPFLIAISNVLGVQMMFPFHRDRAVLRITLAAGLVNMLLALAFVPRWQAPGMALAVVLVELFVTSSYFLDCSLSGINPLSASRRRS